MKKHFALALTFLSFIMLVVSCNKKVQSINLNANNINPTALLPLTAGNTWIYADSTFDSTYTVKSVIVDSASVINQSVTVSGNLYWLIVESDSNGYAGSGGYYTNIQDQNGYYDVLGLDISYSPYFFFGTASADGVKLVPTYTDPSVPTCVLVENQYGFVSTYQVAGYTTIKNILQIANCHGTYSYVTYIAKGVGVVRYEIYIPKSPTSSYLALSQTLTKFKHK